MLSGPWLDLGFLYSPEHDFGLLNQSPSNIASHHVTSTLPIPSGPVLHELGTSALLHTLIWNNRS